MIIYSPLDGDAVTSSIAYNPRHCFLITPLGNHVPQGVQEIRKQITSLCRASSYKILDADSKVTGRDFLWKIWELIASSPLSAAICHEAIPETTQANIYYEIGVAQALGKETLLVKSPEAKIPSNLIRTEYVEFNDNFEDNFKKYLSSLLEQADHYETVANQLDSNPVLALDYLKRAFLITGKKRLRKKAKDLIGISGLENRAKNSVELLAADF